MFIKNDLSKGGSFYIQSKIWVAKEEIMKDFPGAEAEYYKKNEMSDPAKGKKAEATEDKKDAKAEENKEKDDKPAEEKKAE